MPQAKPPLQPHRAIVSDEPLALEIAARAVGADLVSQLRIDAARRTGPAEPAGPTDSVVIEPFIDSQSGFVTRAGTALGDATAAALLEGWPGLRTAPLTPATLTQAHLVMAGSLGPEARGEQRRTRLQVALIDPASGRVMAQSSAWLAERALDEAPLPVHRDSPVLLADQATRLLVAASRTPVGGQVDPAWRAHLPARAVLAAALAASDPNDDARRALALYRQAASLPGGQSLRALSGIYVEQARLGSLAQAGRTFGDLAAAGLADGGLSVRFWFGANSPDFVSDARLQQQTRIWLRQIAQVVARSRTCVEVQGPGGRSADEHQRQRLSLQRAQAVRRAMQRAVPAVAPLVSAVGRGPDDDPAAGPDADDARGEFDRRVDFRPVGCASR